MHVIFHVAKITYCTCVTITSYFVSLFFKGRDGDPGPIGNVGSDGRQVITVLTIDLCASEL